MLTPADKALRVQQVYTDLNRKFQEQETQRQAQTQKTPYINLYGYPIDVQVLGLLSKEEAETYGAIAFYKQSAEIKIGVISNTAKLKALIGRFKLQGLAVSVFLISKASFQHALEGYRNVVNVVQHSEDINIGSADIKFHAGPLKDLSSKFVSASTTDLIQMILGAALSLDASDIHIEPEGNTVKVRFRLDGVLQDVAQLPKEQQQLIISRVKILSKMKLNITAAPQDGSFSLTYDKAHIDLRVSILPSAYGESIVMRILRQDKGSLRFEDLGITGLAQERILKEMEKPNGMLLTTGPTGSGKTTTLYAILNKLNEPGVKIITLEDPVEYKIDGITQTPIDVGAGLTFAAGLRAILRQDPDIVMIGEMRDLETAETAAQAALTGHTVLSTLHTNDAPAAIPRLLDMGIKPFVLAPAINAIIGQRLVRKICTACKTTYKPAENLMARVEAILKAIPKESQARVPQKLVFSHSPGCAKCNGLGYKGRIGVYEVFIITDQIEKMIADGKPNSEIRNQAISEGMITMAQDGILKALTGITDIEEVFRVTEE